jgi:hypothetical protein
MLEKLRYYINRTRWIGLGTLLFPVAGSKHHARSKLVSIIDSVNRTTDGDEVFVRIEAATEEQERQAALLLKDYEQIGYRDLGSNKRICLGGFSWTPQDPYHSAEVLIEIDENWNTTAKILLEGDVKEYWIGAFPLPAIRAGKAPDEHHGFDLDERTLYLEKPDDRQRAGDDRC